MKSPTADNLTIRRVSLNSLELDPANARSHGDRNLDAIRASLQRFGQTEPLVVQKQSGRVIGGNGLSLPRTRHALRNGLLCR